MANLLESPNVFIDTEYFDSINYGFDATALRELIRLVRNKQAKVFSTSVTLREMQSHLDEKAREAAKALKSFRDTARIVRNLPDLPIHAVFQHFDIHDAAVKLRAQLDEFLQDADVGVLELPLNH
jgi:PIN domain